MFLAYYFLGIILVHNIDCYKADHTVNIPSKSVFTNKKVTKAFTPARYVVGNRNIKYESPLSEPLMPEHNFPRVEYPTSITETSPLYLNNGEYSALLSPFPGDVKKNFNSVKAQEKVKSNVNKLPDKVKIDSPSKNSTTIDQCTENLPVNDVNLKASGNQSEIRDIMVENYSSTDDGDDSTDLVSTDLPDIKESFWSKKYVEDSNYDNSFTEEKGNNEEQTFDTEVVSGAIFDSNSESFEDEPIITT